MCLTASNLLLWHLTFLVFTGRKPQPQCRDRAPLAVTTMCPTYCIRPACLTLPISLLDLQDPTPVQDKGPPKSITVEDSFKDCSSLHSAHHVIRVLAPDLLARMVEDSEVCPMYKTTLPCCLCLGK